MRVLVDTSVWSLSLRKLSVTEKESKYVSELRELIKELRVAMIGPVRQELLSGISNHRKFILLKGKLDAFEDESIYQEDYEMAAEFSNSCRATGVQGSHIVFFICAVAIAREMSIFTTDKDFLHYSRIVPIRLHEIRKEIS